MIILLLKIDNLNVLVGDKQLLHNYNLNIDKGEIHAIMGPNGSGKSTLAKVIMGAEDYKIITGDIYYDNEDITKLKVDERARKGIFLAMQSPLEIEGITNADFLRTALNTKTKTNVDIYQFIKETEDAINELKMDSNMLHRSINSGFSGGERKKNEILQMKILKPKLIILDEIDSGLDIDSLKIVAHNILQYQQENKEVSILIITHYPRLLNYIKPDYVHIMTCGKIVKSGDYELALKIENQGYNNVKTIKNQNNKESTIKEKEEHE